ncbi:MAG: flagellar hook-associated protein FlgL [Steroidobacteraceae bacterium]|jgi:flagellar hook-associated protein 3 FlgL
MRVTQSLEQTQFLAQLDTLESNIATTQSEISSGLSFTTPSQNPAAAGEVDSYDQVLAQSQQYSANANAAQTGLNTEDTALTQVTTQLQSLRDLALEANSGTESTQNLSAIATEAQQIQQSLLSLANTQDGNGNYIFAGYATQTEPFSLTATGATYSGDQGQPKVQIAAGQTVASADNGDTVFNQIKTGNGTFTVAASANNTGSGVIGAATVTDPATYTAGDYSISFTGAATYQVLNSLNAVVTTGTYTSGQAISFNGVQVTLTGQPATGDSFAVAPSTNQSIFTTVQNLVTALQSANGSAASQTQLNNTIAGTVDNIDQALNQVSTVQASVGGRLDSITTQLSVGTSQQAQLQQSISNLQSLDYASAVTTLESQNTTLSAAMQAFSLTQGLSLFKYLS